MTELKNLVKAVEVAFMFNRNYFGMFREYWPAWLVSLEHALNDARQAVDEYDQSFMSDMHHYAVEEQKREDGESVREGRVDDEVNRSM